MNTKSAKKAQTKPPRAPAGQIPPRGDWETEWARLKLSIVGYKVIELTDVEKLLLINDSESLDLDPVDPTYPPTQLQGAIVA